MPFRQAITGSQQAFMQAAQNAQATAAPKPAAPATAAPAPAANPAWMNTLQSSIAAAPPMGPTQPATSALGYERPQWWGTTSAAQAPTAAPAWIQNIQAEQARNPMGPTPAAPAAAPAAAPVPAPAPVATAPTPAPAPAPSPVAQPPVPMPQTPAQPPAAPPVPSRDFTAETRGVIGDSQYTATQTPFDEAKGVEGRINSIIGKGSPLMQLAETRALQQANRRGLSNSSMAVGAGQRALYDAAMPIAQQDAGLYSQQSMANQNAANTAAQSNAAMRGNLGMEGIRVGESSRQFDVGQAGQNDRFNRELQANERQFDVNQAGTNERFKQELDQRLQLAGMDAASRLDVVNAQAKNQALISSNENIANAWGTTMSAIDKINANPDLGDDAKKTQINNALGGFRSFSNFWQKATGGAVDVSDLLSFGIDDGPLTGTAGDGAASGGNAGAQPTVGGDGYWDNRNQP